MKTNTTIIRRPLATAALLLTIFAGLSSCESAEPVKPKSAYGPILPPVIADTLIIQPTDTLIVQPTNPNPVPIKVENPDGL